MAMTRYVEERKFFAEERAVLADYKSHPRMNRYDLFRVWNESRSNLRASALAMLDRFTSTANGDNIESDTPIDYVDDPKTEQGKAVHTGRWRLVSNQEIKDPANPDQQGIVQHLRLHSLATILSGASIDFTLARVVDESSAVTNSQQFDTSGTSSANPAKVLAIEWDCIRPANVSDVIGEFSSAFNSTTAVTVNGEEFGSGYTYMFAAVKDNETDQDGMKIVRFIVGRPEFVLKYQGQLLSTKAYTGYMIWDLPQSLAQTLINTVTSAHAQGISIYPDYDKASHTCSLRLRVRDSLSGSTKSFSSGATCMQTDTLYLYRGYTEAALQSLLSELASSVVAGTWYDISVTEEEEDGLYDATVTKHVATEVTVGPITTEVSSAASTVTTKVYNTTVDPTITEAAGLIQRANWTKNANCTQDTVVEVTTVNNQTATSYDKTAARSETSSLSTQAGSAISSPSRSAGTTVRVENTPTEAGRYRTVQSTTTYIDQTATSYEKTASRLVATVLHTQADSPDTSSHTSAGNGKIVRAENRPTESGKYQTTVETSTCSDQTAYSYDTSMAATARKLVHTQGGALEISSAARGIITRQESEPTEYGKYRTSVTSITMLDQTATSVDNSPAYVATRIVHTENETDLTTPTIARGTITRQEATPTESGNQRTVETVIVPTDQTAVGGESSGAADTVVTIHTENGSDPAVGAGGEGYIYRLTATPTEAGNLHTTETTILVKDQQSGGGEASAAQTSTVERHTQTATEPTATYSLGTIQRVTSEPTEAGLYRTSKEIITANNQTATGGEDSVARSVSVVLNTQTDQPSAPSASPGTVKRLTVKPTEFGMYNVVEEVIAPKSRTINESNVTAFMSDSIVTKTQETTAEAAVTSHSVGTVVSVRNDPTDTGFQTQKSTKTATAQSKTHTSVVSDRYTETTEWHKNATDLPDASAVVGASVSVEGQMNDFGRYDYEKKTRTANVPLSCPSAVSWTVNGDHYFSPTTTYPNGCFDRAYVSALTENQKVYTHTISFHTTAAAAALAVSGGVAGSDINPVGDNLWMAHKVTYAVTAYTIVNFTAPSTSATGTRTTYATGTP